MRNASVIMAMFLLMILVVLPGCQFVPDSFNDSLGVPDAYINEQGKLVDRHTNSAMFWLNHYDPLRFMDSALGSGRKPLWYDNRLSGRDLYYLYDQPEFQPNSLKGEMRHRWNIMTDPMMQGPKGRTDRIPE